MSKNNYQIFIHLIKLLFVHQVYIYLIIFISELYTTYSQSITSGYPSCFQLEDNVLLLANKDGIFCGDLNLSKILYFQYGNPQESNNYENNLKKLIIARYDDNVICFINNYIYLFDKFSQALIFSGNAPNKDSNAVYLNLLPYKKDEDNYYHYFFINLPKTNGIGQLNIFHYKYKNHQSTETVSSLQYKPFYLNYHGIIIISDYFTCQIMNSQKRGDVLTCCYFTHNNKLIVVQSFDIENEIQEIEEYYSKFPIDDLNIITSTISPNRKNMLVCYSPSNRYGYCFNYNFDSNTISNNRPVIEYCENNYAFFKLNYFPQTEEYVFICKGNGEKFTIVRFDENFNKINPDEITSENFEIQNYNSFNSISLIYDNTLEKYVIISDSKESYDSPLLTRRFIVNTNFSNKFESNSEKPVEFQEIYENPYSKIEETSKYYVYTKEYSYYANSRDHKKVTINFVDEYDPILKTKDNKPINTSLYWMDITKTQEIGRLVINIDGEEKEIGNKERINNVSELYYYPEFNDGSNNFVISYSLYLTNYSIASASTNLRIYVCKENCSCYASQTYCGGCLEDFVSYHYSQNCISKNDLNGKIFIGDKYEDCYKMCKKCSAQSGDPSNMKCETCYTEHGDYQVGENCYEKQCDNLFYWDKDTGMKTCVNESKCPEEYPILKENTKECMHEIVEETSSIKDPSKIEESSEILKSDSHTETSNTEEISEINSETSTNKEISSNEETSEKNEETSYNDETSEKNEETSYNEENSETNKENSYNEEISETSNSKTSEVNEETSYNNEISKNSNSIEEDKAYNYIKNLIEEEVKQQNLEEINKTYSILSNAIKNANISYIKKDIIISGVNITYQLTTSENQKHANYSSNVSVIDLGECEKIIKRNISNENDPTPLLILKIDIKKVETKSTAVEYEVYNPYTKEKIDLSICSNTTISIYAPVNLTNQETSLYNNLNGQGYDLFDVNNSFYIDPCSSFTSENGTDVSLKDRKNYYYNEDIVLCEDTCKYIKYYLENNKAYCQCSVKSSVNVDSDQEFSPQVLLEKFYKIDTYANFEVLYCYKLVFSSKGLKKNICFYIILILLVSFLTSMIINLFSAIKKLEQIIFKIFQDRFMYYFMQKIIMEGRKKRNLKSNNNQQNGNDNKGDYKPKLGLNWIERLKLAKKKKKEEDSTTTPMNNQNNNNNLNLYNINNLENNVEIKVKKKKRKKKKKSMSIINISNNNQSSMKLSLKKNKKNSLIIKDDILNNENNKDSLCLLNSNNIKNTINVDVYENNKNKEENCYGKENESNKKIKNSIENKDNPPIKKNNDINKDINDTDIEENLEKKSSEIISKKKKKKHKKKSFSQEKGIQNISVSIINLKKLEIKNTLKKTIFPNGENEKPDKKKKEIKEKKKEEEKEEKNKEKNKEKKEEINEKEKDEKQKAEEVKKPNNNSNIKYIDEELNIMDYENALINDNRNYWQYYWSFLKKKHMIILTFVSNDDYNVFLLKISLFILSLALFFSINTFFYRDTTFHQIFSEKGKYSLIYQIPQILYSTLISFVMTLLLKKLSLSQSELLVIKKELDRAKSNLLATKTKKKFKIKLYSFFFIGLFLLLFFWYYITAFGAVYKNTQLHLIKDTLFSFGLSMGYPLIINLIPSLLRYIALKSEQKNKKCLYKTSQIIGII